MTAFPYPNSPPVTASLVLPFIPVSKTFKFSPKTLPKYGQEFQDAGFIFTRAGTRKRGEIAWAVSKIDSLDIPLNPSEMTIKEAFSSAFDP